MSHPDTFRFTSDTRMVFFAKPAYLRFRCDRQQDIVLFDGSVDNMFRTIYSRNFTLGFLFSYSAGVQSFLISFYVMFTSFGDGCTYLVVFGGTHF